MHRPSLIFALGLAVTLPGVSAEYIWTGTEWKWIKPGTDTNLLVSNSEGSGDGNTRDDEDSYDDNNDDHEEDSYEGSKDDYDLILDRPTPDAPIIYNPTTTTRTTIRSFTTKKPSDPRTSRPEAGPGRDTNNPVPVNSFFAQPGILAAVLVGAAIGFALVGLLCGLLISEDGTLFREL